MRVARLCSQCGDAEMFGNANAVLAPQDQQGRRAAERGDADSDVRPEIRPLAWRSPIPAATGMRREFEASGQPIRDLGSEQTAEGSKDGKEGKSHEAAVGGVVTRRDVTERSLHRLQDQFVSLASHELRSPLTSQVRRLADTDQTGISTRLAAPAHMLLRLPPRGRHAFGVRRGPRRSARRPSRPHSQPTRAGDS